MPKSVLFLKKMIPVKSTTIDQSVYYPTFQKFWKNRVGCKRLNLFLNQQKFFYDKQFGFKKNHSASPAVSVLVDIITRSLASKQSILGVASPRREPGPCSRAN